MTNIYSSIPFEIVEGSMLEVTSLYELKRFSKSKKYIIRFVFDIIKGTRSITVEELGRYFVKYLIEEGFAQLQSNLVVWRYLKIVRGSDKFKYVLSKTQGEIDDENFVFGETLKFEIQRQNQDQVTFFQLRGIPRSWDTKVQEETITKLETLFLKPIEFEPNFKVKYIGSTTRKRDQIIACTLHRYF